MNKQILYSLIPVLSVVKRVTLKKVYLNALPVMVGLKQAIKGGVHPLFFPFMFLPLYQLFGILVLGWPLAALARSVQVIFLILFGNWMIQNWKDEFLDWINKFAIAISVIVIILELILTPELGWHDRAGFGIPRFNMIVGEPNFSTFFFVTLFTLNIYRKKYLFSFPFFIFMLMTHSRMGILALIVCLPMVLLRNKQRVLKFFNWTGFSLFFLYPFALLVTDKLLSVSGKIFMINKLSTRYYLHLGYMDMWKENPLGVGYYNGKNHIQTFLTPKLDYLKNTLNQTEVEFAEQHNMFVQTFSELGFLGALILIWFFYKLTGYVNLKPEKGIVWGPFLVCALLLNCFHEVAFYMVLSFVLWDSINTDENWDLIRVSKRFFR